MGPREAPGDIFGVLGCQNASCSAKLVPRWANIGEDEAQLGPRVNNFENVKAKRSHREAKSGVGELRGGIKLAKSSKQNY